MAGEHQNSPAGVIATWESVALCPFQQVRLLLSRAWSRPLSTSGDLGIEVSRGFSCVEG